MNTWDQILTRIETKVNRHSFYTWFKPTSFLADAGASISVRVPNPLFTNWLTKHYSVVISEALVEVRRPSCQSSTSRTMKPRPPSELAAVRSEDPGKAE
jgi:chromosomal replication initiator protein